MKNIFAVLLLMVFVHGSIGNAIGQESTKKELALEYLKLSKFEQTLNASIDTYSSQLSQQLPDAEKSQLRKSMQEAMGWDVIKDQLADLVVKLYTREELKAAIAFEKSRLGKSISTKNELLAKQFAELLMQNMQRIARKDTNTPPSESSK